MEDTDDSLKHTNRRKRKKLHGKCSLLKATIQEYGLYDKEIDAFRGKFQSLFKFLGLWQRQSFRSDGSVLASPPGKDMSSSPSPQPAVRWGVARGRDLCLEEELELRLEHMTSLAHTLRSLWSREREWRQGLYRQTVDCRDRSLALLTDMLQHFHQQTGLLQAQLLEAESGLQEAECERQQLHQDCEDTRTQAANGLKAARQEMDSALQQVQHLSQDLGAIKSQQEILEQENDSLRRDVRVLSSKVGNLEKQIKELHHNLNTADMARLHFETLLDIAVNKLRLYEDAGMKTRLHKTRSDAGSSKSRDTRTSSPCTPFSSNLSPLDTRMMEPGGQRRRPGSDNVSISSLETISLASDYSMSLQTSRKYGSEDRLSESSAHSRSTLPSRSPIMVPRRRSKKTPFFSKPFLRKSPSSDSQMSTSMDRLPTIADELDERGRPIVSQAAVPYLIQRRFSSQMSAEELEVLQKELRDSISDTSSQGRPSHKDTGGSSFADGQSLPRRNSHAVGQAVRDEQVKVTKKVKRTSSFGGMKSRKAGGLVALAKDIEKRFKKRRRSKTADVSDIKRAQEAFLFANKQLNNEAANDEYY